MKQSYSPEKTHHFKTLKGPSLADRLRSEIRKQAALTRPFAELDLAAAFAKLESLTTSYLDTLSERPAYVPVVAEQAAPSFAEPAPPAEALDALWQTVHQAGGIEPTSGRFMGYIPGGALPAAAFGDFVAALSNRYAGYFQAGPGAVRLENAVITWLLDLFNLGRSGWGTLTSGGSTANLIGILAAREGLPFADWPRAVCYLTAESHHSIGKALKTAGLGVATCRIIPTDAGFRMDAVALRRAVDADERAGLRPWLLVANAGTTSTGSIDPLPELARIAADHRLWFHVDAAYGGFFQLTGTGKERLAGIDVADSLVLDPHKGLFLPYGTGAVLVKNAAILQEACAAHADYLADVKDEAVRSPADYSLELTRHWRAPRLWLSLKMYGLETFAAALNEKLLLAEWLHGELSRLPELEVAEKPDLSVVAWRVKETGADADAATRTLLKNILADGGVHVSSSVLNGRLYLRACILCFRTHLADVETLVRMIKAHL